LSGQLIRVHEPQALYRGIVDVAMTLMKSDAASMQILDPTGERLLLVASRNFHPDSEVFWQSVDVSSAST
jgi:hypothetical protein